MNTSKTYLQKVTLLSLTSLLLLACAQQQSLPDNTQAGVISTYIQNIAPRHNATFNITEEEMGLFTGIRQYRHFNSMYKLYPSSVLEPALDPYTFPTGRFLQLPETYRFNGKEKSTQTFLSETDTAALLVLEDGNIRLEYYGLTGGVDVKWISWSMAKSFTSALIGIALKEKLIKSLEDDISSYLPALKGSAYDGASIKDVLQMSSGARWTEDYSDPESDIFRLGAAIYGESTYDEFVASMVREFEPGTVSRYNSADTQVLGMLLTAVTGRSITSYMQEKLSDPLGMEHHGYWLTDKVGREMAFGGLNLTALDYAKIGELYRKDGIWNGRRILPRGWVQASTQSKDAHVKPGKLFSKTDEESVYGYGYQWWTYAGDRGDFSANGIYNQTIFVDPLTRTTIVKLSATPTYGASTREADNRSLESLSFLRTIVQSMKR